MSVFAKARSAEAVLVVVAVAVLLAGVGSVVELATLAALVIVVPAGAAGSTLTTRVNVAEAPVASVGLVDVTSPVPPTAGVVLANLKKAGDVKETKVVPAGMDPRVPRFEHRSDRCC